MQICHGGLRHPGVHGVQCGAAASSPHLPAAASACANSRNQRVMIRLFFSDSNVKRHAVRASVWLNLRFLKQIWEGSSFAARSISPSPTRKARPCFDQWASFDQWPCFEQ